jgi:hypothetical protein
MVRKPFAECSIYALSKLDRLENHRRASKSANIPFKEQKPWVTGHRLWLEAGDKHDMPVLWGDATKCGKVFYWGILTFVGLEGQSTLYRVRDIRTVDPPQPLGKLRLKSTGQYIKAGFIRSYAIVETKEDLAQVSPSPTRASPTRLSIHSVCGHRRKLR